MKNIIKCELVLLMTVTLASCVQRSKYEEVTLQRDSLAIVTDEQNRLMETLQSYIGEISSSLDSISVQESILFLPDPESKNSVLSKKEKIKRLESFQHLIDRQRDKIDELEQVVRADSVEFSNLHSIITYLSNQIKEKDQAITRLKEELQTSQAQVRKLNVKIDGLNSQISSLNDNIVSLESVTAGHIQALNAQDMLLNEAYFCFGDRKELAGKGVKFGVKTNYSSVDKNLMDVVDIRDFRSVRLNSTKVKILTPMPAGSYSLAIEGGQTILEIINPGSFWSNSNILIIQTDALLTSKK